MGLVINGKAISDDSMAEVVKLVKSIPESVAIALSSVNVDSSPSNVVTKVFQSAGVPVSVAASSPASKSSMLVIIASFVVEAW